MYKARGSRHHERGRRATLLTSQITSATAVNAGYKKPYANFPDSGTVVQSLRPFPQYNSHRDAVGANRRFLVQRLPGQADQALLQGPDLHCELRLLEDARQL